MAPESLAGWIATFFDWLLLIFAIRTPAPVAFNEAVELANRYSDEQGRRMINGVLRRFHDAAAKASN